MRGYARNVIGGGGGGGEADGALSAGISTHGNTSGTTGFVASRMLFVGSNNITLSQSVNGQSATLTISAFNQSTQSAIQGFGASNTGNTAGNTGISTGINWVLAGTNNVTVSQSTAAGGPNTLWLSAAAGAADPGSISAGTTRATLGEVVFANSNGISFGVNGQTVTGTVQTNYLTTAMQSDAATISNIRVSAGTTSNLLSAITFANSNGVTFGLNASTLTASVATGGGAAPTLSLWHNLDGVASTSASQDPNATLMIRACAGGRVFPGNMTVSTMFLNVTGTQSTGAAFTRSLSLGFYTLVNSTQLSLAFSASTSWGSNAANANFGASFGGPRWVTFQSSQFNNAPTFSQTQYWMALWNRSSSGSQSYSLYGQATFLGTAIRSGFMSAASVNASTHGWFPMHGQYSASVTTAMPNAIAGSDLNRSSAPLAFIPHIIFNNVGSNII